MRILSLVSFTLTQTSGLAQQARQMRCLVGKWKQASGGLEEKIEGTRIGRMESTAQQMYMEKNEWRESGVENDKTTEYNLTFFFVNIKWRLHELEKNIYCVPRGSNIEFG